MLKYLNKNIFQCLLKVSPERHLIAMLQVSCSIMSLSCIFSELLSGISQKLKKSRDTELISFGLIYYPCT